CVRLAGARVERRLLAGVEADLFWAGDRAQLLGGLEELLGRDAPPVQTRAADPFALDQRDAQACRRAVQRGGITARSSSEDDDIELLGQDGHPLRSPIGGVDVILSGSGPGFRRHDTSLLRLRASRAR